METYATTTAKLSVLALRRASDTIKKVAQLASAPPRPDAYTEAWELAQASLSRAGALQASWLKDWGTWAEYAQSIEGANTMPKYVDRTGNIFLQAQAQMVSQATDTSELLDNISVSYAYWINQQVEKRRER